VSYSRSIDITIEQHRKLIPKFLKLLDKYGYGKAKIIFQINLQKGDKNINCTGLTIAEFLEKLEEHRFESGGIKVNHKNKEISLKRSQYKHDLTLELNSSPDAKLNHSLDTIFLSER